jgi:hypothetical protein
MNRLKYDNCAYRVAMNQSVAPIDYMLDVSKYENCSKCRPELGIVGGTAVSHVGGNFVDLESSLMGIDRPATQPNQCPYYLYHGADAPVQGGDPYRTTKFPPVATDMKHLPACQFATYRPIPVPTPVAPFQCPQK